MIRKAWVEDDLGSMEVDADRGSTWEAESDEPRPRVRRPIGFMRRKPIVRVKAWTQPRED